MKTTLIRRALMPTAVAALLCSAVLSANHSWGNYHWARTANPFTLDVGDNVSSAWDSYLFEAIGDWSASNVLDLRYATGGANPKNCRPTAGRIEACNSRYGNNGWLGIAQIWASGSHITQATTKVNDTYFNTATYNTPAWRRLVMCQEIAHDFGLDHQDENFNNANLGSCMDYTSDPDGPPSNEHPNSHDFAQLQSIYSHLDSTTTISQLIDSPGRSEADAPEHHSEWGRLIRQNENRRVQVFELDLGRGNKMITHVFWADPEGDERGRFGR